MYIQKFQNTILIGISIEKIAKNILYPIWLCKVSQKLIQPKNSQILNTLLKVYWKFWPSPKWYCVLQPKLVSKFEIFKEPLDTPFTLYI